MKKSMLALLLALSLVVPVFAVDKGMMEADVKLGYIIEPLMAENGRGEKDISQQESTFSLGADFYYYLLNNIGVGLGINYIFDSDFADETGYGEGKLGDTNIYLSVKPVLEVEENKFIDKVYFLGHLGLGITRYESGYGYDFSQSGLYLGIGAGVEKCNVIVELLYSVNYWCHNDPGRWSDEWSYTNRRLAINVGYKFSF